MSIQTHHMPANNVYRQNPDRQHARNLRLLQSAHSVRQVLWEGEPVAPVLDLVFPGSESEPFRANLFNLLQDAPASDREYEEYMWTVDERNFPGRLYVGPRAAWDLRHDWLVPGSRSVIWLVGAAVNVAMIDPYEDCLVVGVQPEHAVEALRDFKGPSADSIASQRVHVAIFTELPDGYRKPDCDFIFHNRDHADRRAVVSEIEGIVRCPVHAAHIPAGDSDYASNLGCFAESVRQTVDSVRRSGAY